MKIQIVAVGVLKSGPEKDLFDQYVKRLTFPIKMVEIPHKQNVVVPSSVYLNALSDKDIVIILDEGGKNLSSREFSEKLNQYSEAGKRISFVIGGADGIPEDIKKLAKTSISFGRATWPHLLARGMLVEQLYRAQQIKIGHPYHRD